MSKLHSILGLVHRLCQFVIYISFSHFLYLKELNRKKEV